MLNVHGFAFLVLPGHVSPKTRYGFQDLLTVRALVTVFFFWWLVISSWSVYSPKSSSKSMSLSQHKKSSLDIALINI